MIIDQCQVGQHVDLFVDATKNKLTRNNTGVWRKARLLAYDPVDKDYLVGWKTGESYPDGAHEMFLYTQSPTFIDIKQRSIIVVDFDDYGYAQWVDRELPVWAKYDKFPTSASTSSVAVNNHTCPTCKNSRVSKSEKTCWLCGNAL